MKLFYTDSLAAAYMAREFDVMFMVSDGSMKIPLEYVLEAAGDHLTKQSFIIHPDSYSIFEPKDGDKDEDGFIYDVKFEGWTREFTDSKYGKSYASKATDKTDTAKRNGKQFFTPEVEDD